MGIEKSPLMGLSACRVPHISRVDASFLPNMMGFLVHMTIG
jgi:hypothetical protein